MSNFADAYHAQSYWIERSNRAAESSALIAYFEDKIAALEKRIAALEAKDIHQAE